MQFIYFFYWDYWNTYVLVKQDVYYLAGHLQQQLNFPPARAGPVLPAASAARVRAGAHVLPSPSKTDGTR